MTLEEILAALDDLSALDLAGLTTLRESIVALYAEMRDGDVTDEVRSALRELVDARNAVDTAIEAKEAEAAQAAQELADLDAAMQGDDGDGDGDGDDADGDADGDDAAGDDADADADADGDGGDADGDGDGTDADADADGADATDRQLVTAGGTPARPSLRRMRGTQRPARTDQRAVFGADVVTASGDVPEIGGQRITNGERFAQAMTSRAEQVAGTVPRDGWEKFSALSVRHQFDADLVIGPRATADQANDVMDRAVTRFLAGVNERVDAMDDTVVLAAGGPCIPPEPDFSVEFIGGDHRPFSQAFPTVQMPRSRVSFYGPIAFDRDGCDPAIGRVITLAQDTAGYNAGGTGGKVPFKNCVRIDCPDEPLTCQTDIMLKCVTIGNWVDRTWPEWVRVFNQNVDACYSLAYEQKHMAQVVAGSTLITAGPATFGATVDFLGQILTLQARVKNARRLTGATQWRLIVPEWFTTVLRIDVMRYMGLSENSFAALQVTDAQIIAWLSSKGINVSTYVDDPGDTAQGDGMVLGLPAAGPLLNLPGTVRTFFFPEGTWVRGTGGVLDLGVVRDSSLNQVNDFQTFMEEWTTMCKRGLDSYVVDHVLCPSGLIGGTVALDCVPS